jgi:CRISPR system Cascade subunit CasD
VSTLLLKLSAPLQSWGADSKFDRRGTEREPTKSGVIGLIACALGYGRDENEKTEELAKLKFGVRVDKPGSLLVDFQTVKSEKSAYVTYRHYLADAEFTAGLEDTRTAGSGKSELLERIEHALRNPVWPLYLGRRGCPPAKPIVFEKITEKPLKEALSGGEWAVFDADDGSNYKRDIPESFSKKRRMYGFRRVEEIRTSQNEATEHDAFGEVQNVYP